MKIKLPKDSNSNDKYDIRGTKFERVFTVDMNGFDIETFLPSLFFTILSQGKGKARNINDPRAIKVYIDKLANHPSLEGFTTTEGRLVLEKLVRTSLINTGGIGRSNKDEQINAISPYSLLSHKPGFPVASSRQRGVDQFIYQALLARIGSDDALRTFFKTVFGKGVIIGTIPELGGNYDGQTDLDTMTRLSIAFLDGFENTRPGINRLKNTPPACPGLVHELATDLWRYMFDYYAKMPVQAFTHYLLTLMNFELFNYTIKLIHAVNELIKTPEVLPQAMHDPFKPSGPEIYVDFTGSATGPGLEMAKACIRRDMESIQTFLGSNLLLRQLDHYTEKLKRNIKRKAQIETILHPGLSGPEYLQALLLLKDEPGVDAAIDAAAQFDEDRIIAENTGEDDNEALPEIEEITNTAQSDLERVVNLLAASQRQEGLHHYTQWFWGVGGMKTSFGIMQGSTRYRHSWRYQPANDLLAVLVQVAAARLAPPRHGTEDAPLEPIRLQDFLKFLDEHYGILVDRPPGMFEGAEYTAAARENLRAMLRRLNQMGIFRDLSDDFTVQRLHPPYGGRQQVGSEA